MRGPWGQLGSQSSASCAGCCQAASWLLPCLCVHVQPTAERLLMWLCLLHSLLCNSHLEDNTRGGAEGWRCCTKKGTWLVALILEEPNPLPNPELLPGFLSWKLFLNGSSHFQQFLKEPRPAAPLPLQLHHLPALGFVSF